MKKNNKNENNINIKNQSENSSKEPTPDSPLKQNTDQESPRTPKRKYHNSDNDNQGLTISPHTPKQKSTGSNDNNKEKNLSPHTPENKIQTNNLFGQQAKANSRFKTTNSRRKLQTPLSISSGNYEITTPPTTPTGKRKSTIQPDLLKAPKKKRKTSEENRRYREKFLEIEDKNREEELLELKAFYQKQVDTILSSQTLLNQYAQKVTKYLKTIDDGFQIFIYNSEQLRIVEYDITDSILDIGHYDHYFHIVKNHTKLIGTMTDKAFEILERIISISEEIAGIYKIRKTLDDATDCMPSNELPKEFNSTNNLTNQLIEKVLTEFNNKCVFIAAEARHNQYFFDTFKIKLSSHKDREKLSAFIPVYYDNTNFEFDIRNEYNNIEQLASNIDIDHLENAINAVQAIEQTQLTANNLTTEDACNSPRIK